MVYIIETRCLLEHNATLKFKFSVFMLHFDSHRQLAATTSKKKSACCNWFIKHPKLPPDAAPKK
jgi:hypothetical protein